MEGKITPPIIKFLLSSTTFQTCITCITKIAQVKVIETILKDCGCSKKLIENCTQCHHKTAKPQRPLPVLRRLLPLSSPSHHFVNALSLNATHMGPEHASREKISSMVIFLIFVHKNVCRIRFQEIKMGG